MDTCEIMVTHISKVHTLNQEEKRVGLAIYGPMIYIIPYIMFLMQGDPLRE